MNTDWIIVLFLVNLSILAYVRYNYANYIKLLLYSLLSSQASNLIFKDSKNNKIVSFLLNVFFYITASIFISQIIPIFRKNISNEYWFFIIPTGFLILFLLVFVNKFVNFISGKMFLLDDLSLEYNHNINVFNQSLGVLLFPIILLISYTKEPVLFTFIGLSFFVFIYVLKIIRLFQINFSKHLNFLYLFLYLCTLEIIPILYIVKLYKFI